MLYLSEGEGSSPAHSIVWIHQQELSDLVNVGCLLNGTESQYCLLPILRILVIEIDLQAIRQAPVLEVGYLDKHGI